MGLEKAVTEKQDKGGNLTLRSLILRWKKRKRGAAGRAGEKQERDRCPRGFEDFTGTGVGEM